MRSEHEREMEILQILDGMLRRAEVKSALERIVSKARIRFNETPDVFFIWEEVPLSLFDALPEGIRSSWIFIIRAGLPAEPHRHPNSHQISMSLVGDGDLQIWKDSGWHSHPITSDPSASLENRWVSIPPNVWHQAVITHDWVVMAFHTADENDLIEEAFTDERSTRRYSKL
jgi:hypothetical protein